VRRIQRFLCWSCCFLLLPSTLAGAVDVAEMRVVSSVLSDLGGEERVKRVDKDSFLIEDSIYHFVTLTWDDVRKNGGKHKLIRRWYTGDKLVAESKRKFYLGRPPQEFWGYIRATMVGPGEHKSELYIDNQLIDTREFSITDQAAPDEDE